MITAGTGPGRGRRRGRRGSYQGAVGMPAPAGAVRAAAAVSALAVAAVFAAGCSSASPPATGSLHFASVKASDVPAPDPAAQAAAVAGLNSFGLALYRQLGSGDGNLVFSPQTLDEVLTMILPGAKGETESQLAAMLGYSGLDPAAAAYALGAVEAASLSRASADGETLTGSDALWTQQGINLQSAYLNVMAGAFDAGVWQTDFEHDASGATNAINQQVSQATHGLIPSLFPQGVIDGSTRLVLTSASYFKAPWTEAFDPDDTINGPFTKSTGGSVQVPMMNRTTSFKYAAGTGWQAVELPYGTGGKLAMDIILPASAAPGSLAALRSGLTADELGQITGALRGHSVNLSLPRFTVTSSQDSLNDQLEQLGATAMFGPHADLSGLFANDKEQLQVTDVLQKAYIQVGEKGTTAAAAAGAAIGSSAVAVPQNTVNLTVDHPFVYLIRDTVSGQVFYLGQVGDPS